MPTSAHGTSTRSWQKSAHRASAFAAPSQLDAQTSARSGRVKRRASAKPPRRKAPLDDINEDAASAHLRVHLFIARRVLAVLAFARAVMRIDTRARYRMCTARTALRIWLHVRLAPSDAAPLLLASHAAYTSVGGGDMDMCATCSDKRQGGRHSGGDPNVCA